MSREKRFVTFASVERTAAILALDLSGAVLQQYLQYGNRIGGDSNRRGRFGRIWRTNQFKTLTNRKPHDALYKAHHVVF